MSIILFAGTVFMGFFAIMNPIANTPVFISLTNNVESSAGRRKIAFNAIFYAFIIVSVFCIAGHIIFKLFGITLPAFQITGGILLFVVGMHMLNGKHSTVVHPSTDSHKNTIKQQVAEGNSNVAITPLAMPILAGPGTIATAMNFIGSSTKLGNIEQVVVVIVIFAIMCFISFLLFIGGAKLIKLLGHGLVNVISRIMGLILAVIAVQMVISGLNGVLKMYYNI
ncbi:MAG: MarC family protein [Bacteroidales bacterium]|nr:MarC family protein [Bacteroidales bacterium]MCF8343555.1 MarC family protein [Bacteroidales bacterium]MCF8351399.1 MarC family protein [Bacteroidales bacterium]MCF8375606.1 MarC family protein [Bacteroidales bacterium]